MRDEHFGISVVEFMAAGAVATALTPRHMSRRDCVAVDRRTSAGMCVESVKGAQCSQHGINLLVRRSVSTDSSFVEIMSTLIATIWSVSPNH